MKLNSYIKSLLGLFCLSILAAACVKISPPGGPLLLQCEYQTDPIGIDALRPRLSWMVNDSSRGAAQTAYQILVASSLELLEKDEADIWDSGKTLSEESALVTFTGSELKSNTKYYWKVRTWNNEDMMSPYSKPASWHMGLLRSFDADWSANWIGNEETGKPPRSIMLRKEFETKKPIKQATAFVTGLGNYLFYLNGEKVGKDLLTPGWTHYPKKIQYQSYDVTSMLKSGKNAAGAILGNMWWSSGLGWQGGNERYSEGPLRFLLSLHITYTDGSKEKIISDKNWLTTNSPFVSNTLYHGVTYDARLEQKGWAMPGFQAENWDSVAIVPQEKVKLVAQQGPPIQVVEEVKPMKVTEVSSGKFVADFGINMVGWVSLKVKGDAGKQVTLRFAELLDEKGNVDQRNLRSAKATDKYILKGEGEETFEPMFTYHGFRYVEISGVDTLDASNLVGKVIYSAAPTTGTFECSNELLNKIQENIVRGQRSNMHSVPTDCPQRDERLGWMGDAQIFAPTASYNMNMSRFFAKWEKDITDSQHEQGYVHDVNPAIVVKGPSRPGWGDAVVVVPWIMYKFYGDKKIITDNYEGMVKWVTYMERKANNYLYDWADPENPNALEYGDWIAPVESPKKPIGAAYFFYSAKLLGEMSRVIGKDEEGDKYDSLCSKIQNIFQETYFDEYTANYDSSTQTANLLPVAFGITPPTLKKRVIDQVAKDVEANGFHPSTGFLGTSYLLPLLSEYGHHEVAYKTATQTSFPSWGYMVENGATTMWELWNSDKEPPESMNSRNHFALGCVGEWYFGYLAGIRPETFEPGFKSSVIAPMPAGDLTWAKASLKTNYGTLESHWQKKDGKFILDVAIPANTASRVRIPLMGIDKPTLIEGTDYLVKKGRKDDDVSGIQIRSIDKEFIELIVGGGRYSFVLNLE
ncbi:family 78 glycoside hydrolase catalytic domain [Flammeovirgaceae bacterium SG7u.111]|nr:family 78 glycoside hydrolase catalytic domain [Flammeovirgaceae bacterium SG7u.132]WPO33012.1 family 78 glycoside hydrolase catalytic domain [Flammeovirgaceae bacterium SG7u.111]